MFFLRTFSSWKFFILVQSDIQVFILIFLLPFNFVITNTGFGLTKIWFIIVIVESWVHFIHVSAWFSWVHFTIEFQLSCCYLNLVLWFYFFLFFFLHFHFTIFFLVINLFVVVLCCLTELNIESHRLNQSDWDQINWDS